MRIVTIVGARPQFVKAAAVSRKLRAQHTEILVHTGQHYDHGMSGAFFDELGIPAPDYSLGTGSGSHGMQTGRMLEAIEAVLLDERPDAVLVYGDTNSTLAGALAAAKLHIPVIHIEAGLRSFNNAMPEEINRILTDRISTLLLCPSSIAVAHLAAEGIVKGVHVVGDVMLDALLDAKGRPEAAMALVTNGVTKGTYAVATVHRAENTDDRARFQSIMSAFANAGIPILFPVHPRTRSLLDREYAVPPNVTVCEPLGYLDMVALTANAALVLTDSGGLQKEAYWLEVPCVTLREQTEWTETVTSGWNQLAGADGQAILAAIERAVSVRPIAANNAYGLPDASSRVVNAISDAFAAIGAKTTLRSVA